MIKKILREYSYIDENTGKNRIMKVNYTLFVEKDSIVDIRNEYGFSIEKNSECWDYLHDVWSGKLSNTSTSVPLRQ